MSAQDSRREQVEATIMELLAPYNKEGVALTPETSIAADLNIDSADVLNFVMEVEDAFDIDIPVNDLADIHNVSQLADLVERRLQQS